MVRAYLPPFDKLRSYPSTSPGTLGPKTIPALTLTLTLTLAHTLTPLIPYTLIPLFPYLPISPFLLPNKR